MEGAARLNIPTSAVAPPPHLTKCGTSQCYVTSQSHATRLHSIPAKFSGETPSPHTDTSCCLFRTPSSAIAFNETSKLGFFFFFFFWRLCTKTRCLSRPHLLSSLQVLLGGAGHGSPHGLRRHHLPLGGIVGVLLELLRCMARNGNRTRTPGCEDDVVTRRGATLHRDSTSNFATVTSSSHNTVSHVTKLAHVC